EGQGIITFTVIFPGRCPGLSSGVPLALEIQCRYSVIHHKNSAEPGNLRKIFSLSLWERARVREKLSIGNDLIKQSCKSFLINNSHQRAAL
ncbi:MAG TPA: hypothetical protein PK360_00975, partial [bacterium]|nr:hypothetical protein [bacterium]